ncbi:hypothetical protein GCM10010392_67410 [Streptomyces clavifer]|uniref:DUF4394 domain-containing protein n=1 Tax=Streptomyces clavifer TaxID=68188 RepID=A0ABS4VI02_9ACTN|nr:hypothetical protein [Streptomyces clavifer]GHB29703.1 hypothetical protein GCM10010392_67410 [Streptomyces clavifer]
MRISLLAPAVAAAVLSPLAFAASAAAATPAGPAARTAAVAGETAADDAPHAIGLAHDQLVAFSTHAPGHARSIGHVRGLSGDTKLVGIDYRVQNGALYGVGDQGGIYTLDTHNAKAAKVSQLTVDLDGEYFGVDFNPAANRLRVISDTGQNLRHNIDDKAAPRTTTVDGKLTNPATPPSTTPPTAKGVTGAGYTNNDLNSDTATTLFDLDTVNDRVSLQSPANAGSLAPTGSLGVKAGPSAGFDVHYAPKSGTNHGFATLHVNGTARLYGIDLLTGAAAHKGDFPSDFQVTDLAVALNKKPQGGVHTGGGALASATLTPGSGVSLNAVGAAAGTLLLLGGIGAGARVMARRTNTNRVA